MAPISYQLVMRSGPTPGKIYPLSKAELYIGRDIANEIVITDSEISRKHVRLTLQGNSYILEDLGSTNGTFVNGQRLIGPHTLRPGETVMLGENVGLIYEMAQPDPNATVIGSAAAVAFSPTPPVVPPPAIESYEPAASQAYDEQPAQAYAPPPPMVEPYVQEEAPKGGNCRKWGLAGCGCLLVVMCLVVVGALVFDSMNLYCQAPFDALFSDTLFPLVNQIFGSNLVCP